MSLVTEKLLQSAFEYYHEQGDARAQAAADMIIAERRTRAMKAKLILSSPESTDRRREAWAECHADYHKAVEAEADAAKEVEWHRHQRSRADAIIEAWRTEQSTLRGLARAA